MKPRQKRTQPGYFSPHAASMATKTPIQVSQGARGSVCVCVCVCVGGGGGGGGGVGGWVEGGINVIVIVLLALCFCSQRSFPVSPTGAVLLS